jgi:hypothetical protein
MLIFSSHQIVSLFAFIKGFTELQSNSPKIDLHHKFLRNRGDFFGIKYGKSYVFVA